MAGGASWKAQRGRRIMPCLQLARLQHQSNRALRIAASGVRAGTMVGKCERLPRGARPHPQAWHARPRTTRGGRRNGPPGIGARGVPAPGQRASPVRICALMKGLGWWMCVVRSSRSPP